VDGLEGIDHLLSCVEREANAKRRSPAFECVGGKLGRSLLLLAGLWGPPSWKGAGSQGPLPPASAFALEATAAVPVAQQRPGQLQKDAEMDPLVPPGLSLAGDESSDQDIWSLSLPSLKPPPLLLPLGMDPVLPPQHRVQTPA